MDSCCKLYKSGIYSQGCRWRGLYLSDHTNILSDSRREAFGGVLGVGEIVEPAAVQGKLEMFQV